MIEGYEIEQITIRKPWGAKPGDGKPLDGEIKLNGFGNELKLKIDPDLLKPIVDVIAGAIAEAGRRAAQAMMELAEAHHATVIEHQPEPAAIEGGTDGNA